MARTTSNYKVLSTTTGYSSMSTVIEYCWSSRMANNLLKFRIKQTYGNCYCDVDVELFSHEAWTWNKFASYNDIPDLQFVKYSDNKELNNSIMSKNEKLVIKYIESVFYQQK